MKSKTCFLCKQNINEKKDRYVHIQDFNKGKKETDRWCHLQCFNKGMNRELTEMEKKAQLLLNQAEGIFGRLQGKKEVYEIGNSVV